MPNVWTDAHRNAAAQAIAALGNRIGLYVGGTRIGTVYADTTWGTATKINESGVDKAQIIGSKVTISIPGGTLTSGAVIDHYGVHNGTTLLRRIPLPFSLTVGDGAQSVDVDVTPILKLRGE
ncbi:hypothetical protein SEA_GENAMY16_35 [Gordonia phage Genamy16]|uniref:Uncharacterized protein n=2 Tax=Lambovirus TaxID=2843412 RepID=A0A9E7TV21_9CAUD|nr:hypothetical protein SEA_GENAMY16_35 [Gordonia phage Genamy16]UVF61741.1 hypothetical protein SEA_NOVASHARKS_34 [Gordonia phage NovaSharks]UVK63118.1 hypothetical protein SEA_RUMI_34 [Gordonia phage Rumi]WNM65339.1 hypothetical protein SEA_ALYSSAMIRACLE_35 [Gordonia phage Alyssamiracle]